MSVISEYTCVCAYQNPIMNLYVEMNVYRNLITKVYKALAH